MFIVVVYIYSSRSRQGRTAAGMLELNELRFVCALLTMMT
jgi:hypothetical protein